MANSVEQYRKLVRERFGTEEPDGNALADIALEVYGDDYYTNPGKYEDLARAEYVSGLAADDPQRLAYGAAVNPDLSPDAQLALLSGGMTGDAAVVNQMRNLDYLASQEATQATLDQQTAQYEQEMKQRQFAATEDQYDWMPVEALKATVRTGFTALEAPFQIVSNVYRAYGGAVTGQNENDDLGGNIFDIFAGTDLGAMSVNLVRNGTIDTGDGWFGVDPDSRIGQYAQQRQGNLWTLENGEIATFGRSAASLAGLDKDSVAYGVVSGGLDLLSRIADPTMYVGAGAAKAAVKTGAAYARGGKEAAAVQRSINDGTAIGMGTSVAKEAADAAQAQTDQLGGLLASRDALLGQATDARARVDAASEAAAQAVARRSAAEVTRETAEQGAIEARLSARDALKQAREEAAARQEELAAAREEAAAIQSRLDEANARFLELDGVLKGGVDKAVPPVDNLATRLDKDTELQGLTIRLDMAFEANDEKAIKELSSAVSAREGAVREQWAKDLLAVPAIRDAYLKSRGMTEAGKAGRGSDEFAEFESTVDGASKAFPKYGAFGKGVAEEPMGLTGAQDNAWKSQGVVPLAWAKREFGDDVEAFWSWLNTGNREAHLSLRMGERESFANEFGYAPTWTEIDAMSRTLGRGKQRWLDVPWAASNKKYERWASGINDSNTERILSEVIDDPRDFMRFVEEQRAAGVVRYSDDPAPVVRIGALREERKQLLEQLKVLEREAFAAGEFQDVVRGATRVKGGRAARASEAVARRLARIDEEMEVLSTARKYDPLVDGADNPIAKLRAAKSEAALADEAVSEATARVEQRLNAVRDLTSRADELDAKAAARAAEVDELAAKIKAERQISDEEVDTVEGLMKYLSDEVGLVQVDDGKRLLVDNALQAIFSGKMDPVVRAFAQIDDVATIVSMTRGKIADPALLRALARAKTEDQVKAVLTSAIANGDLAHNVGKLKVLRLYSRTVGNRPVADESRALSGAFGVATRAMRWSINAKETRVPWSYDLHIEDGAQMMRGTMDYIKFVTKGWDKDEARAFESEWVNKMAAATDGVGRKAVGFDLMNDILTRSLARSDNLSAEDVEAVRQAFMVSRNAAMNKIAYNANEAAQAAATGGKMQLRVGDDVLDIDAKNLPMLEAILNERFHFPDPRLIQRLAKSVDAIKKNGGKPNIGVAVYEGVFDDFWRTAVLLRVSYVVRNSIEMQTRMALSRHPSMFTNPFAITAMAARDTRFGKFLKAFRVADLDATGRTFKESAEADRELNGYMNEFMRWMETQSGALLDVGTPRQMARYRSAGFRMVRQGEPGFWTGAANEVLLMNSSPIARAVLAVASGRSTKEIDEWARTRGLTREEAVVDMAFSPNGPLSAGLADLRTASRNTDFEAAMSTREGVAQLLFDRNNPFSYYSRWNSYTGGFRGDFVDVLWTDEFARRADIVVPAEKAGAATLKQAQTLGQIMSSRFAKQAKEGNYNVREVGVPEFQKAENVSRVLDSLQSGTDWFFKQSGRFERATGVQPEQQFSYWDTIAEVITGMSPEEAAKVVANARKSLGGIKSGWASVTLRKIEKGAKKAEGALTVNDVNRIGVREAARKTEELFYVAMKRNQFAHAIRLIFPFAQAWANSLIVYSRLIAENSQIVYRAGTLLEAGKGEESNVIYEALGNIPGDPLGVSMYDPEQGFFYNDPYGKLSMQLPFASTAVRLGAGALSLAKGDPMLPDPMRLDTSLGSMNMVFQGGLGPGFGPIPQAAASVVRDTPLYNALPDGMELLDIPVIKEQLMSYQDSTNPNGGAVQSFINTFIPPPFRATGNFFGVDWFADSERFVQPLSVQLMQNDPDKYTEIINGERKFTPRGQQLLMEDATRAAVSFNLAHSLVRFTSPGSLRSEFFAKDKDGAAVSLYSIGQIWKSLLERYDGDRGLATRAFLDQYGTAPLLGAIDRVTGRGFPTDSAYDWWQANPNAKVAPEVAEMLFSGGRYSLEAARAMARRGTGEVMTFKDVVTEVDNLTYAAQVDALKFQKSRGVISEAEYTTRMAYLNREYADVRTNSFDTQSRTRRIAVLEDALQQPGVSETPAYTPLVLYYEARNRALDVAAARGLSSNDLGTAAMSDYREWLFGVGEKLLVQYPEFKDAWENLLRAEVEE